MFNFNIKCSCKINNALNNSPEKWNTNFFAITAGVPNNSHLYLKV